MKTELTKPTLHMNGTGKTDLLDGYLDARNAVNVAINQLISNAGPNGRDYYPQGPDALSSAIEQHRNRIERLRDVSDELLALAEHCNP